MDLASILSRYAAARRDSPPKGIEDDFDEVARQAPPEDLKDGLAEAFRADETPEFESMVADLYDRSDAPTKTGLLDRLSQALGNRAQPKPASEVGHDRVRDMAREARAADPNILERVSEFYARHPQLVRNLGSIAMGIALNRMATRRR